MTLKNLVIKTLLSLLLITLITACNQNTIYMHTQHLSDKGWHKDSACAFDFSVADTSIRYNVYINIRSNDTYPYQNLWLFINKTLPNKQIIQDTIEFYLADKRGRWIGKGIGSVHQMNVLYQQNMRFDVMGTYRYDVVQAMRENILLGISDISMHIEKTTLKVK